VSSGMLNPTVPVPMAVIEYVLLIVFFADAKSGSSTAAERTWTYI